MSRSKLVSLFTSELFGLPAWVIPFPTFNTTETTMNPEISDAAARLWPNSETMRHKWIEAISYLRNSSKGWVADQVPPEALRAQLEAVQARESVPPPKADKVVMPLMSRVG